MTDRTGRQPELAGAQRDRRPAPADPLVARIARSWRPEPLDEPGRLSFDARLGERIGAAVRPGVAGWWAPVASASIVVAIGWWAFRPSGSESLRVVATAQPAPVAEARGSEASARAARGRALRDAAAWEWELLLGDAADGWDETESALPEEYRAIAREFRIR